MNFFIVPLVLFVLLVFHLINRVKKFSFINSLFWAVSWWIAFYVILKNAILPPLPSSIVQMFMAIITIALFFYITADTQRLKETIHPIIQFLVNRKFTLPLGIVIIIIPLLVAGKVYLGSQVKIVAPVFGRSIHPAPPTEINYQGRQLMLNELENPYRHLETENPTEFQEHIETGRKVYYNNCVFCHGDTLDGKGIFAHGFNPIPANFADVGTIAQLQESYVFWRVAKGAPDLPDESGPWSSAMPAWEKFLTEDEIWDVILFIYDFTGHKPRAKMEHH